MSHLQLPNPSARSRSPSPTCPRKSQTLIYKRDHPPPRKTTEKGFNNTQETKHKDVTKKLKALRARIAAFEEIRRNNPEEFRSLTEFRPTGRTYNAAYDAYHEAYTIRSKTSLISMKVLRIASNWQPITNRNLIRLELNLMIITRMQNINEISSCHVSLPRRQSLLPVLHRYQHHRLQVRSMLSSPKPSPFIINNLRRYTAHPDPVRSIFLPRLANKYLCLFPDRHPT